MVEPKIRRAVALVLIANLFFAAVDTSTKWLLTQGLVALQLAFMRYFGHLVITLGDAAREGQWRVSMTAGTWSLVALRSFCLVSATVVNFYALGHLPLAVSSAILFVAPVLVALFAWRLLGEAIGPRDIAGLLVGFAGVLLVVWPFGDDINLFALVMLYPASGMAMYLVLTRMLANRVSPAMLQLNTGILGTLVLVPFGIMTWKTPADPLSWALMIGLGLFAWAGHEVLTRAHAYAAASALAPFGYSFVVYLGLSGWLVFGTVPSWNVALGAAVICGAGLISWSARRHG